MHRSTRLTSMAVGIGVLLGSATLALPAAHASTATAVATATRATSVHKHPRLCKMLEMTLGRSQGAAGSTLQNLRFRNISKRTCTVRGYPRVHYVSATKARIGVRAARSGQAVRTVRLAPGKSAKAILQVPEVGNFSAGACKARPVAMLEVRAGRQVAFLPWNRSECTTRAGRASLTPYRR